MEVRPDWSLVATRIDKQATNHWDDSAHVDRLTAAGVRIVRGRAGSTGPAGSWSTATTRATFVARRGVMLNAGTDPATLPIDGLAETPYWTNREVVRLTELPASLVVIGGGPSGAS